MLAGTTDAAVAVAVTWTRRFRQGPTGSRPRQTRAPPSEGLSVMAKRGGRYRPFRTRAMSAWLWAMTALEVRASGELGIPRRLVDAFRSPPWIAEVNSAAMRSPCGRVNLRADRRGVSALEIAGKTTLSQAPVSGRLAAHGGVGRAVWVDGGWLRSHAVGATPRGEPSRQTGSGFSGLLVSISRRPERQAWLGSLAETMRESSARWRAGELRHAWVRAYISSDEDAPHGLPGH